MHVLWSIAFGTRPSLWNLPALLIWALFGNADDGPYGFLARAYHPPHDWATAARWWVRNPAHNLWFYVLALPLWWRVVLIGQASGYMPASRPGVLVMLSPLPFICLQSRSWTAYIGFRPQVQRANVNRPIGAFGIALRRA